MAMSVKSAKLWVLDANDRAGLLADTLGPLASAGASLRVVMAYRHPGQTERAAVEVYPIQGKKAEAAAQAAGMQPSQMACLLVEGDDRPGMGAQLSRAIASSGQLSFGSLPASSGQKTSFFAWVNVARSSASLNVSRMATTLPIRASRV